MEQKVKEHPLPARIIHWIHLATMIGLVFSGFYIHRPFFTGAMGLMRYVHFICMYVILLNLVVRIYWAFFGREHDWREFVLTADDLKNFFPMVAYYLFLRKDHPETGRPAARLRLDRGLRLSSAERPRRGPARQGKAGKYNPLQKLTYNFWVMLLIVQGVTGFSLYQPALASKVWGPFFQWFNALVGGAAHMRLVHYLIMWVFIVTTAVHIYLSLAEDFPQFLHMLFGLRREEA